MYIYLYVSYPFSRNNLCLNTSCADGVAASVPTLRFGVPLSSGSNQIVLLQLITHMETFATQEGLFRKPGNRNRVDQMAADLSERGLGEVISDRKYKAHDFASVLKQYFAELPEPVTLRRHMEAYLQASGERGWSHLFTDVHNCTTLYSSLATANMFYCSW